MTSRWQRGRAIAIGTLLTAACAEQSGVSPTPILIAGVATQKQQPFNGGTAVIKHQSGSVLATSPVSDTGAFAFALEVPPRHEQWLSLEVTSATGPTVRRCLALSEANEYQYVNETTAEVCDALPGADATALEPTRRNVALAHGLPPNTPLGRYFSLVQGWRPKLVPAVTHPAGPNVRAALADELTEGVVDSLLTSVVGTFLDDAGFSGVADFLGVGGDPSEAALQLIANQLRAVNTRLSQLTQAVAGLRAQIDQVFFEVSQQNKTNLLETAIHACEAAQAQPLTYEQVIVNLTENLMKASAPYSPGTNPLAVGMARATLRDVIPRQMSAVFNQLPTFQAQLRSVYKRCQHALYVASGRFVGRQLHMDARRLFLHQSNLQAMATYYGALNFAKLSLDSVSDSVAAQQADDLVASAVGCFVGAPGARDCQAYFEAAPAALQPLAEVLKRQWDLLKPPVPGGGFIDVETQTLWLAIPNPPPPAGAASTSAGASPANKAVTAQLAWEQDELLVGPVDTRKLVGMTLASRLRESQKASQCEPVWAPRVSRAQSGTGGAANDSDDTP